jgi:hypothetical protein
VYHSNGSIVLTYVQHCVCSWNGGYGVFGRSRLRIAATARCGQLNRKRFPASRCFVIEYFENIFYPPFPRCKTVIETMWWKITDYCTVNVCSLFIYLFIFLFVFFFLNLYVGRRLGVRCAFEAFEDLGAEVYRTVPFKFLSAVMLSCIAQDMHSFFSLAVELQRQHRKCRHPRPWSGKGG